MNITRQSMEKEIPCSTSLIREMKIKGTMDTILTYSAGKFKSKCDDMMLGSRETKIVQPLRRAIW